MSYSASSEGTITVKTREDIDKAMKIIKESGCFNEYWHAQKDSLSIEVLTYRNEHYNQDSVFEFFGEITPFVKEAEIKWVGEDNALWKHGYDQDFGWYESPGQIVYDDTKATAIHVNKEDRNL